MNGDFSLGALAGSLRLGGTLGGIGGSAYSVTKVGAGTIVLGGSNSLTGNQNVNQGVLAVGSALGLGTGTVAVANGASFAFNGAGTVTSTAPVFVSGTGNSVSPAIGNLGGSNTFNGNITMLGNTTMGVTSGSSLTLGGNITGGFNLTKTGTGRLNLSGANTINNLVINSGPTGTAVADPGDAAVVFNGTNSIVGGTISFGSAIPTSLKALAFNTGTVNAVTLANNIVLPSSSFGALRLQNDLTTGQRTYLSGLISGGEALSSTLMLSSGQVASNSIFRFSNASNSFAVKSIYVQRGTLAITSDAVLGAAGNVLQMTQANQGAGLRFDAPNINLTHAFQVLDHGSIFLRGDNDGDGIVDTVNDATISSDFTGGLVGNFGFDFLITGGSNNGTDSVGALTLSGNNTTQAPILVAPETSLIVGSTNALGSALAATSVQSNGSIKFNNIGTYAVAETLNLVGQGVMSAGVRGGALQSLAGDNILSGSIRLTSSSGVGASVGVMAGSMTFNGVISGSGNVGSLTKVGAGNLIINSISTFTGTTVVAAGSLTVNGNHTSSPMLVVNSGATLSGTGTVGNTTVNGLVTPTGVLTTGSLAIDGGSATFTINSTSDYTSIAASDVSLLNSAIFSFSLGAYTPVPNDSFVLINNTGLNPINGTFAGYAEGAVFSGGGYDYSISYLGGNGNDVLLTVVPEPATVGLLALAGAFAATRRRRR